MELEDTEIVVVCELCNNKTPNFNRHMRTHHPGCGGKALFTLNENQYVERSCFEMDSQGISLGYQ